MALKLQKHFQNPLCHWKFVLQLSAPLLRMQIDEFQYVYMFTPLTYPFVLIYLLKSDKNKLYRPFNKYSPSDETASLQPSE